MKNVMIGTVASLLLASVANGQTWAEVGDAGELAASAQSTVGSGPLSLITGSLAANDVDMFHIRIDDPSLFIAQHTAAFDFDSQMFLFNMNGTGVAFRDDATGLRGAVSGSFVPAAGDYLLAISGWDRDPVDAAALPIWNDTPFAVERAPDGAGAANPVASWSGNVVARGQYEIAIRGASFVPSPGSAALAGIGGLLVARRRRTA